jgi:hypothetical protein
LKSKWFFEISSNFLIFIFNLPILILINIQWFVKIWRLLTCNIRSSYTQFKVILQIILFIRFYAELIVHIGFIYLKYFIILKSIIFLSPNLPLILKIFVFIYILGRLFNIATNWIYWFILPILQIDQITLLNHNGGLSFQLFYFNLRTQLLAKMFILFKIYDLTL